MAVPRPSEPPSSIGLPVITPGLSWPTILEYYKNDIPRQCIGKPNYRLGYTLGLLTVEALSAIGGTESTMKIYEIAAKDNKNFNVAFKDVFGIIWNEAAAILAEVVAKTRKKWKNF